MNTPQHDQLTRALAREAEQFHGRGGTDLEIGQVLARAGSIRRGRRMRASVLMAACVLAVAAPVGIISLDHDSSRREPTPARQVQDRSPLGLTGLGQGAAPHLAFVQAGSLSLDGAVYKSKGEEYVDVAPYRGGVMLAVRGNDGELTAHVLGSGPHGSWPMSGGFAVSPGHNVVAFAQPDGTPVVVQGDTAFTLPKVPRGTGFEAVAVSGEDCKETASNAGCTVWVNSRGQKPEAWVSTSHGFADHADARFLNVADVFPGRLVAGYSSITDGGSCSTVDDTDGAAVWQTCDRRLLEFSPDGKHLLASAAYADGMGDTQLAVLDAATGKPALDLRTVDGDVITQMVWEDDSHVLAIVFEGGRWGVVRIGLDGRRELAVAPVRDSGDLASPFVLASR